MKCILVLKLFLVCCVCSCAQTPPPQEEKKAAMPMTENPPPPEPEEVWSEGEMVDARRVPKSGVHIFTNPRTNLGKGIKDYSTGEILLEPIYDFIEEKVPGFYKLKKGDKKYGIYELKKREITIPVEYRHVWVHLPADTTKAQKPLFIIRLQNDKYGYIDHRYKTFLDTSYDYINYHEVALLMRKDEKVGINFLDESIKDIPIEYDQIRAIRNTKFNALKDSVFTLFDKDGTVIFDKQLAIFQLTGRWEPYHTDILLMANQDKKIGIYDVIEEKMAIPQNYERMLDVFFGYFIIEQEKKFGVIDKNNTFKIPMEYDSIGFLNPGVGGLTEKSDIKKQAESVLLLVSKNRKFGLINRQAELIVPIEYDEVDHIFGCYKVKKKGKYFILDAAGKKITRLGFDEVGYFYNGKCAVFKNGKMGYLKPDGRFAEKMKRRLSPKGFKDLDDQFEQFVIALKSEDDAQLRAFCERIVPGEYTIEFMMRTNMSYRGFPQNLNEKFTRDKIFDQYYQELKRLRNRLKRNGELESLAYQAHPEMDSYISYLKLNATNFVLSTEFYGGFVTDKKTFKYRMGKMMYIDGFWKSFSLPKKSAYNLHYK